MTQSQKRKKNMPDLQSELNKILNQAQFDDDADKKPPVVVTTPKEVVETTEPSSRERAWRFVKDNPGVTVGQIAEAIGSTSQSIAGGLHKMVLRGDLTRERADDGSGFRYYAATESYEVMSMEDRVASMMRARAARKGKPGPKPKAKRSVKKAKPSPIKWADEKPTAPAPQAFDADAILAGLNVLQARELMDKLKQLFGG